MTLFRVIDLKQYIYCPRIIYYHQCLPQIRPTTYKMQAGIVAQDEEEGRAARRSLRRYNLQHGECENNIYLESEALGLRGKVDMMIKTNDNQLKQWELIPVDYKLSNNRLGIHFKLQLLGYGLLLEEIYGVPSKRGFLYAIPKHQAIEVAFTPGLRTKLNQALLAMQDIIVKEYLPTPPKQRAKCETCEFRRFCNDVV